MFGSWSRRMLGRSVSRWLMAGRKQVRRPVPVRPALEGLEKRDLFSVSSLIVNPAPSPTEGAATGTFTVATFTGMSNNQNNYSGTIAWGDGTTSTFDKNNGLFSSFPGATTFAVLLGHTYAEENTSTVINISVRDASDNTTSATISSSTFAIADAPLSSLSVNTTGWTEGTSTKTFTVATFHDAYLTAPVSDFTATISWGDGSTTTLTGAGIGGGIVSLGSGNFALRSSHTYADAGTMTLAVQVLDHGGSSVSGNVTIAVAEVPLSNLTINAPSATEGIGTGRFTVASFTDANTLAPATHFTATVTWGDSTSSPASILATSTPGVFNVVAVSGHTYPEEGSKTLSVQVLDYAGASISGSTTVSVADAALSSLTIHNPNATEGISTGRITVASFTDANISAPATDFTATVTWGDSTSSAASVSASGSPGIFDVVVTGHTYPEEGSKTLSVQILDIGGSSVSGSRSITVADAALGSLTLNAPSATEGISTGSFTVASFTDANSAAPATDFTATVSWGDSTLDSAASVVATGTPGVFNVVVSGHTYAEEGSKSLSVQILDIGGASVSGAVTVSVADAALGSLTINAPVATEGISTGSFTVATFTDANSAAPISDFTATVSWGDSTLDSAASVVATGTAGVFDVVVSGHTYAEEGSNSLSVQVLDIGGSSISGAVTVSVADAALFGLTINAPSATEGIDIGSFTVASFTDANSGAPATDFTATIDWGDGSPESTASVVATATPGVFDVVVAGHTYIEEGNNTLSVDVLDVGGSSITGDITITVADAPLSVSVQAPPVSEGVDSYQIRVATFHDGNPLAPASDFQAVIAWGDGSTSTVTSADNSIRSLGGGDFAVWSRHTYTAEEGNVTLSVQVTDSGGASATASRSIPIADAALNSLSIKSLGVVEGGGKSGMTVATFHDANTLAPATDFTATVSWGDGGTTTLSGADGSIVALGGGNFALLSNHTYAEEGAYSLSVQILDIGGSSIGGGRSINVPDASLTGLSLQNPRASEGISTSTFTVATFRDLNTAAPVTDFTATISWGDGGTSTVSGADGSIVALGGGSFALLSSHTYAEEGTRTLSVQILDSGGASTTGTLRISVADAPLSSLVVQDPGATEGSGTGTFTVATFHDGNLAAPASDFTARVTWGDGSTTTVSGAGIVSLGGGDFAVLSSHTYADEGTFTLAVQITDVGGARVTGNRTIAVADAALSSLVLNNPDATEGIGTGTFTLAAFSDANTAAPATDFTAVVQWGDGSTTTVAPAGFVRLAAGSFALLSSHTYADEGTYSLSVQVLDKGGASVSGALTVSVADAPLSVSVQAPAVSEGVDSFQIRVATFHDGNVLAPASDFTAVIAWGDGSTSTVTSADNSIRSLGGGDFAVWSRHTYTAEEGNVTLSVQVTDVGGASATASRSIPVSDAALNSLNIFHLGATEGIGTGTITVATFHDANTLAPATDFTATISWGDSSTSTVSGADGSIVALGGGNFALLAAHTYAEEGTKTVSVEILDIGGASLSGSRSLPVADAALSRLVITAPPAVAGIPTGTFTVATFHDANLAAPVTDFTATIGWGDGGTTTVTSGSGGLVSLGGGDFAVLAEHTYSSAGSVILSVLIADAGGSSTTRSLTFSVKS